MCMRKEDVTIKLSESIDVDKGDGNHCDFVPIIDGVAVSKCHVVSCTLYFELINLSRSAVTATNINRFSKLISSKDKRRTHTNTFPFTNVKTSHTLQIYSTSCSDGGAGLFELVLCHSNLANRM